MVVRGTATSAQIGLVRCYQEDLAHRDIGGLSSLMANTGSDSITGADLQYSMYARRTPVTATFTLNPFDTTDVSLTIAYRGGAVASTDLTNVVAFGGPSVWRIDIGTSWDPQVRQPRQPAGFPL